MNVSETDLATFLGISRQRLREVREGLRHPEDWGRVGRQIVFTEAGVARLQEVLAAAVLDQEPAAERETPPTMATVDEAGVPGEETPRPPLGDPGLSEAMLVVASVPRNPRLLTCSQGEATTIVRVRDNRHFLPGMEIRAVRLGDSWVFQGRLPRFRGKW